MNALKAVGVVAIVLCLLVGAEWIGGYAYYLMNKTNPFGQVTLFTWWEYWHGYPDDIATRRQLTKAGLFGLIVAFGIPTLIVIAAIKSQFKLHGEARFATAAEIKAAGLMKSTGIIVGKWGGRFLMYGTQQFVSLLAPTRTGKGVGIVIPNLLNFANSTVVLDVKLENWRITSRFRAENGQKVYLFNPFSLETHQYNPLAYISDDPRLRIEELLSIGYMVYPQVSRNRDSIWNDSARNLFVGLGMYLAETPGALCTIGEIFRQGSGKGKGLKQYLKDLILDRNYDGFPEINAKGKEIIRYERKAPYDGTGLPQLSDTCVNALQRFIGIPDTTAGGIEATFSAPLTLWANPMVDAATSGNDFDLRRLRQDKISVYMGIPVNKLDQCELLLNLFFSQLIKLNTDELLGTSPKSKHDCLLLLDEFLAPGYMSIIDKAMSSMAGYGLRLMTIAQSKAKLSQPVSEGGYGREGAKALLDNHALSIMFTPKDQSDANDLSEMLGYDTVKSRMRDIRLRWRGTESDQKRALMLPQELKRMSQKKQIIDLEGVRPIKCKKIWYFEERVFIDRLKSVSPTLTRMGRRFPNEEKFKAIWSSGELSAPVPTQSLDLHEAKCYQKTRDMTAEDVSSGVDLDALAMNTDDIVVPTGGPLNPDDVDLYVNSFWGGLDTPTNAEDVTKGELPPEQSERVEFDMSVLQAV